MEYNISITTTDPITSGYLLYNEYVESVIALNLIRYLTPFIVIIGTIGNMLSFTVLMRRPLRRTSIYVYLAILAWADTAVLYLSAFKTWIRLISGWELLHVSDAACRILTHLFVVSLHMAAWLIVAMSIDRLIVVLKPLKTSIWCTTGRAKIISISMFIVFCLIHAHIFWKFDLREENGRYQCAGYANDEFIVHVFPWLRLVTYSIIPFCIITLLNVIIICKLIKDRPILRKNHVSMVNRDISAMEHQQNKLTIMLLIVSFVWLAFSAPFTIWRLVHPGIETTDQRYRARVFLARTICFMFMWLNHGINFALYCLTGQKFRGEFVTLVRSLKTIGSNRDTSKTTRHAVNKSSGTIAIGHPIIRGQTATL